MTATAVAIRPPPLPTVKRRWVWNPMLVKEVLVSSRRLRTYALRLAYLLALLLYSVIVFNSETGRIASGVGAQLAGAATADAGKKIADSIAWFQFIATQAVMAIMMSTAIRDEAKARTLGVLLSTPMSHFQIVWGKLLAKLLNVFVLLACSLPLLMLLRVMGGVPAQFIILSFGVSLTGAMLVGAVVLGRAGASGWLRIIPFVIFFFPFSGRGTPWILTAMSPYRFFGLLSRDLLSPTGITSLPEMFIVHAILMVGVSMLLVWGAAKKLKSMDIFKTPAVDGLALESLSTARAMRRLDAVNQRFVPAAAGGKLTGDSSRRAAAPSKPARRIGNFPIFWRATRPVQANAPFSIVLFQIAMPFSIVVVLVTLGVVYAITALGGFYDVSVQAMLLTILLAFLGGALAMLASATISSERQQRTWQVLLCAPMTRARIAVEKMLGVVWRVRWLYLLIFVHLFAACCAGVIRFHVLLSLLVILTWVTLYALGSGLFFSTHCKTTLVATLVCIGQLAFLWGLLPTLAAPLGRTLCPEDPAAFERQAGVFITASPLNAIYDSIETLPGPKNAGHSRIVNGCSWLVTDPDKDLLNWGVITGRQVVQASVYSVLGLVLAGVSIAGFRRDRDR